MTTTPSELTFDPRRPFSRAEARSAGISTKTLLSAGFRKLGFDSYVSASVPVTPALRAGAVLAIAPPDSYISHHTAAELWGATPPPTANLHVTVPSPSRRSVRRGIASHVRSAPSATTERQGIWVSTPEQTFLDLAGAGIGLVDLVVVGDGLVRADATTPAELLAAAMRWHGRGSRLARTAAQLVRADVDSPMETRLRLLIVLAGLAEPKVNLILRGESGEWRRRFDLCYEQYRLIIEYDGRQHAADDRQWLSDIHRREELDRLGWRLIIVTASGIYREPEQTLSRIRLALLDSGATGSRVAFTRSGAATSRSPDLDPAGPPMRENDPGHVPMTGRQPSPAGQRPWSGTDEGSPRLMCGETTLVRYG